jgi:hypothetical protein
MADLEQTQGMQYDRNARGPGVKKDKHSSQSRDSDVSKLIREGIDDFQIIDRLRKKYPKDEQFVQKIFDTYKDRKSYIQRKAEKFKTLILNKYSDLSTHEQLEKAKKFRKKYNFTDDEFDAFIRIVRTQKYSDNNIGQSIVSTPVSKALGYSSNMVTQSTLNVSPNETGVLQDIVRINEATKILHDQVVVQSLTYRDCSPQAVGGKFNFKTNDIFSYVHPVLAALFLPRIKYLDEHMLIGSLSNIIRCRYENRPIATQPEYELYWDIITDPNEALCTSSKKSPFTDLRNRIILQTKLWESVLNLRQGKYFANNPMDFLAAIDNCNNNIFDAPDQTYVKDEGSILRRVLGAFSLRPTIVSLVPFSGIAGNTGSYNLDAMSVSRISTVSMLTLRLPLNIRDNTKGISLTNTFEQPQWFVENKMIVPKIQTVIHSRDVLFFYANRRYQSINFGRINAPNNFQMLPTTVSGFETVNNTPIYFSEDHDIDNNSFLLRSIIRVDVSSYQANLIIGSSAVILQQMDAALDRHENKYLVYNPKAIYDISKKEEDLESATIGKYDDFNQVLANCSTTGTVFIYVKNKDQRSFNRPLNF